MAEISKIKVRTLTLGHPVGTMFLPQPPSPPDSNLFRVFYSDPDLRVRRGQLFFLRANSKSMGWRNRKRDGSGCKRNSGEGFFPNETFINVRQTPHHENKSRPRQSVESKGVTEREER